MEGVLVALAAVVIGTVLAGAIVGPMLGLGAAFADLVFDRAGPLSVLVVGLAFGLGAIGSMRLVAGGSDVGNPVGVVGVLALLTAGYVAFGFTAARVSRGRSPRIANLGWLVGTTYPLIAILAAIYFSGLTCYGWTCH